MSSCVDNLKPDRLFSRAELDVEAVPFIELSSQESPSSANQNLSVSSLKVVDFTYFYLVHRKSREVNSKIPLQFRLIIKQTTGLAQTSILFLQIYMDTFYSPFLILFWTVTASRKWLDLFLRSKQPQLLPLLMWVSLYLNVKEKGDLGR